MIPGAAKVMIAFLTPPPSTTLSLPDKFTKTKLRIMPKELASFLNLPVELHLQILCLLDCDEIIAFRQTCRTFHYLEKATQNTTWKNCLQRLCVRDSIFPPTFLGRPPRSLELIARRAGRMESLLDGVQKDPTITTFEHVAFDLLAESSPETFIHSVYLLPGGRFMLLVSETSLNIWDLGPYLDSYHAPVLMKKFDVPLCSNARAFTVAGTSTTTVRILLNNDEDEPGQHTLQYYGASADDFFDLHILYELRMDKDGPTFERIAELPIIRDVTSGQEEGHAFSENCVVLILEAIAVFWNLEENSYACWPISQRHPVNDVVLTRDSVLVFHPDQVVIYNIPQTKPLGATERAIRLSQVGDPEGIVSRSVVLPDVHRARGVAPYIGSMADWGIDDSLSHAYPIHDYFDHKVETRWYNLPNSETPRTTVTTMGRSTSAVPCEDQWLPSMEVHRRYGNKRTTIAASMWERIDDSFVEDPRLLSDMKVFASFSPKPPSGQPHDEVTVITRPLFLLATVPPDSIACDFDPLSGILVACSENIPDRPLNVRIYDFVRPYVAPKAIMPALKFNASPAPSTSAPNPSSSEPDINIPTATPTIAPSSSV